MSDPENDNTANKRGPKHTRLRYYTSHEEATIVKLWREHVHNITSYSENSAIFREISFGLQQHRIRLNKQEVRRRISSYRNKYLTERTHLENDPQYKSKWRLYLLIDSLFKPTAPTPAPTERSLTDELVSRIRNEVPSLPRFNRHDCKTIKFVVDPDGCPFLEGQQPTAAPAPAPAPPSPPLKVESPTRFAQDQMTFVKTEPKQYEELEDNQPVASVTEKRSPLAPANRLLDSPVEPANNLGSVHLQPVVIRRIRRRSIMPRTGQITLAQIARLRQENARLAEQRDIHLANLALKEREYERLEQTFDFWLHQQETWMAYLDERGVK